jgi:hypothetical protein
MDRGEVAARSAGRGAAGLRTGIKKPGDYFRLTSTRNVWVTLGATW